MANVNIKIITKRTFLGKLINKRWTKLSYFILNNFAIVKLKIVGESKWRYIKYGDNI